MILTLEQIESAILQLPLDDYKELSQWFADRDYQLESDTDQTIQTAWISTSKQRRDEIRDGSVQPILGEEALAQVRRLIN